MKKELEENIEENFRREKAEEKLVVASSEITLLKKEIDEIKMDREQAEEKAEEATNEIDVLRKALEESNLARLKLEVRTERMMTEKTRENGNRGFLLEESDVFSKVSIPEDIELSER